MLIQKRATNSTHMHANPLFRILLDAAIIACILLGWWYVALPIAVLCAWMLPCYLELPAEGFLYDSLYGMDRGLGLTGYLGVITALALGAAVILLKMVVKM